MIRAILFIEVGFDAGEVGGGDLLDPFVSIEEAEKFFLVVLNEGLAVAERAVHQSGEREIARANTGLEKEGDFTQIEGFVDLFHGRKMEVSG